MGDSSILTPKKLGEMTREEIEEYVNQNVVLVFDKHSEEDILRVDPKGIVTEIYYTQTAIGYYGIEYSGGAWSIMTPEDEYPRGVFISLDEAMKACTDHHRRTLIQALTENEQRL